MHIQQGLSYEQAERQSQRQGKRQDLMHQVYSAAWKWGEGVDFEASWGASHTSQWRPAAAADA